jgi:hypothetical protein
MRGRILWTLLAIVTLSDWGMSFAQPLRLEAVAEPDPLPGVLERQRLLQGYTPLAPGEWLPAPSRFGRVLAAPGVPLPGAEPVEFSEMLPSDARALLKRHEAERAAIYEKAEQQVRELRQKLIEELKPIQDRYTRAGKLDEAVAVRDSSRPGATASRRGSACWPRTAAIPTRRNWNASSTSSGCSAPVRKRPSSPCTI